MVRPSSTDAAQNNGSGAFRASRIPIRTPAVAAPDGGRRAAGGGTGGLSRSECAWKLPLDEAGSG